MTEDELIEIISAVTTLLGTALAQHVELSESLLSGGAGVESQKLKLDAMKARLADEKSKLAKLKDAAKRRRELDKANERSGRPGTSATNESKNSGMVTLRAASGRVIGYMRATGKDRADFFSASGKLVAREVGGMTYSNGKGVYRGRLGLVALGRSLNQ